MWQVDGEEEDWPLDPPDDEEERAIESVEEWKPGPIRTKKFMAEIFSIDRPGEACAMIEVKVGESVSAGGLRSTRYRRTEGDR